MANIFQVFFHIFHGLLLVWEQLTLSKVTLPPSSDSLISCTNQGPRRFTNPNAAIDMATSPPPIGSLSPNVS